MQKTWRHAKLYVVSKIQTVRNFIGPKTVSSTKNWRAVGKERERMMNSGRRRKMEWETCRLKET
jgi:hypothetical protein